VNSLSSLEKLKNASSLKDLAVVLGYKPSSLSYILYVSSVPKYTTFLVPKKSGGSRQIDAPNKQLMRLQRRLADLLYDCGAEIEKQNGGRAPLSHGFRRSLSIITNASQHTRRRYVFNLDLEDFFPSINFGRVRGYFIKNKDFQLHEKVATVVAQIACQDVLPHALPQGSPCSPIISDLVSHVLDVRLVQLAKTHKCTYSRYADDLTFSTNQKTFPVALADFSSITSTWSVGTPLANRISNAGFSVNHAKTRMQCATSRQMVTGLTVNRTANIRADYYRFARSMCNELFKSGVYFRPSTTPLNVPVTTTDQLEGILNHIHHVKDSADGRASAIKKIDPTSTRMLYRRFLHFKYFVCLDKPLVLTEGKTDPIYLKAAIQKLAASYPMLAQPIGKSADLKIHFFNYTNLAHEILQLGGGTGDMLFLIRDYDEILKRFKFAPLLHPVILLIDNDSGAKKLFSIINQKFKLNPTLTSNANFYHLCHNLYLIKTPEVGKEGTSAIEEFFEASLLATVFGGKKFNKTNDESAADEFGKSAFASFVRANADKINFSNFSALLDRIAAVLQHYKQPVKN
jgi:RNA-directed DNA polymerase